MGTATTLHLALNLGDNDGGGGGGDDCDPIQLHHPNHLLSTKFKIQQFQIILLKNVNVQDLRNTGVLRIPKLHAVTWVLANSEEVL